MTDQVWKTAITSIQPNEVRLKGYRIDALMGKYTFAEAIYLAWVGDLPPAHVARLLDAMFVSSLDHGATPPSALAARTAASTGAPLNAAIAAGILSINRFHGAAIQDCMLILREALQQAREKGGSLNASAADLVRVYRETKRRIPGLGHRIHTADPRTARLFQLGEEAGIAADGVAMLHAIQAAMQSTGVDLPINVDGALAALLIDLNMPPEIGNAFFIMARLPGLVAHIHEEQVRERPMRSIHPTQHEYDGPGPREPG